MRLVTSVLAAFLLVISATGQGTVAGHGTISGNGRIGAALIDPTPPMGMNTWYGITCVGNCGAFVPVTETIVKGQADLLVSSGLFALGYNLVSIDATWQDRNGSGIIEGVPAQFPSGMASLATYIHGKGEKFGLYGSPGTTDCVSFPAQFGHETSDANTMTSWGLDYWKEDWCTDAPTIWGTSSAGGQAAYQAMGTPLQQSGRRVSYLVNYGATFSPSWFAAVGATSVRIGADNVGQTWYSKAQGDLSFAIPYQNKGHWLDFDMLMGGMLEAPSWTAMGDVEAKAQFNFYAIAAAPLIIGNRIDALDATLLTTYGNSEVIAVDQDKLGLMGTKTSQPVCGATVCATWVRSLANGDYAVALINYDPSNAHTVSVLWSDFGQSGTFNIRDLWLHASVGSSSTGYSTSLPAWGSTMLRISR